MQVTVQLFIMVLALVLLLLAGLKVEGSPKVSLGWLGLFFWALATLIKF